MTNDRNKLIQNYCLQDLKFINPDQSQVWTAKHIILKKHFTLRRAKYCAKTVAGSQKTTINDNQEWNYQNMMRQANLLKRLNTEHSPKCHKMIKTSNNIYLIYDEFPPLTLNEFIAENPPNRQGKLELMNSIARTLKSIHSAGIMMLLLSCENIYPKDNKDIFLGDWSLACTDDPSYKIDHNFLSSRSEFLAPELLTEGRCSASSDIYSLGKIFNKIYRAGFLEYPSTSDSKLLSMINSMTKDQPNQRPQLADIIKAIEECGRVKSSSSHSNQSDNSLSLNSPKNCTQKNLPFLKIKHTVSSPEDDKYRQTSIIKKYSDMADLPPSPKAPRTPRKPLSFNQLSETNASLNTPEGNGMVSKIGSRILLELNTSLSYNAQSEQNSPKKNNQILKNIKLHNKKRNLAFFLSNLAEFAIKTWTRPELGYLLLKYANLTLQTILNERQNSNCSSDASKQFTDILKEQSEIMNSNLNRLGQSLKSCQTEKKLQSEFAESKSINDRYLKQKIIQFGKDMIIACDKNGINTMTNSLFKTYMILKKIEEGSYEAFWDRIYNIENAFLNNQKYFNQQQNHGAHYIKTKITSILKAKLK